MCALRRHKPAVHELLNQPRARSSIHQICGWPATVTLMRSESRLTKVEGRVTGSSSQLWRPGQAGTAMDCWVTGSVWPEAGLYRKPVKKKSQSGPVESQPNEAP